MKITKYDVLPKNFMALNLAVLQYLVTRPKTEKKLSNEFKLHLYINLACLFVCLSLCLFVSNKRQNGSTDRAQIFCGTSRDPREGL